MSGVTRNQSPKFARFGSVDHTRVLEVGERVCFVGTVKIHEFVFFSAVFVCVSGTRILTRFRLGCSMILVYPDDVCGQMNVPDSLVDSHLCKNESINKSSSRSPMDNLPQALVVECCSLYEEDSFLKFEI